MHAIRLAIALAAIALTGCASVYVARDPLKSPLLPDEGAVLLSITVNTGEIAAFQSILLTREQDAPAKQSGVQRSYSLGNVRPGLSRDTSLFMGTLPAGDYQFTRFDAGLKFMLVSDGQRSVLGSFRVEPGKVTDLGRIVVTAANFKVIAGRSALVLSNRELVEEAFPEHVKLFARSPGGGWNKPAENGVTDWAERYALAHPQGAGGFSELANGEVVGGARMGAIITRNKEGRWRLLSRTDRLDAVLYTLPYETEGNVAVAVGELGTFVRVDQKGKAWPVARGNLPFGNYVFINSAPDHSVWFVAMLTATHARIYQSSQLENGTWQLVREDSIEPNVWSGSRFAWFWPQTGGMGYASSESKLIACFDYNTRQWTSNPPPEGRLMVGLSGGPHKAVGVLTGTSAGLAGAFAKTHVSTDCGSSWQEVSSPYTVKAAAPTVLPSGNIIEGGGAFGDKGLYRSADGGKTWEKLTSEVTVFSERLWSLPTVGLFAVSLGQFGVEHIKHSADEGRTWKLELTSFNPALNKSQSAEATPERPSGGSQ